MAHFPAPPAAGEAHEDPADAVTAAMVDEHWTRLDATCAAASAQAAAWREAEERLQAARSTGPEAGARGGVGGGKLEGVMNHVLAVCGVKTLAGLVPFLTRFQGAAASRFRLGREFY